VKETRVIPFSVDVGSSETYRRSTWSGWEIEGIYIGGSGTGTAVFTISYPEGTTGAFAVNSSTTTAQFPWPTSASEIAITVTTGSATAINGYLVLERECPS